MPSSHLTWFSNTWNWLKNELFLKTLNDVWKFLWQKKAITRAEFKTFANFLLLNVYSNKSAKNFHPRATKTFKKKFKENYLFGEFDEMCSPLLDPLRIILANFPPEIVAKIFYPTFIIQYKTLPTKLMSGRSSLFGLRYKVLLSTKMFMHIRIGSYSSQSVLHGLHLLWLGRIRTW